MRLLQRTLRSNLIYAALVIVVTMPVFYFIIHQMFLEDVDEALRHDKFQLRHWMIRNLGQPFPSGPQDWKRTVEISAVDSPEWRNRYFTIHTRDPIDHQPIPYRILKTTIRVKGRYYLLVLRMSLVDSEDLAQGIITTQFILLGVLLIGLLWLNRNQSRTLWRPFYRTLADLKRFELEDRGSLKLEPSPISEFRDLNTAISQLVEKDQRAYLQQKEFTENASHEMQTPLAVLQTQTDLLLQSPDLSPRQAAAIQTLALAVQRLSRLNKSLLLLARIENRQFMERSELSMNTLVEKTISLLEDQASSRGIRIDLQAQEPVLLNTNPYLMEILFTNLWSNAIRHNLPEGGIINLLLTGRMLRIRNTGSPRSLDATRIFERFGKEEQESKSLGLGLAIVRQICRVLGLRVDYSFEEGWHTFTLYFSP